METGNTQSSYQKPSNLAGLGRRWGGQIIDSLITFFLFFAVAKAAELVGLSGDLVGLLALGAGGGYYLFSDAMPNGQSVGKKILGMSVIDERSYLNCNLYQSFIRNITTPFLNFFDWIFIFFGSRKRLGDMLASTIVIRNK
ncbi:MULTISPECIES: RDD family protein [Pseudomonas]|uniref:RDD family protein n=1 Tax=Pseudomonas aphyarum TaxID=2942629 RepID=A0ABT5PMM8_9PSED|nr:RDD family protein [Pseudomonas aphyarum]MDD0971691.1 RDD family protein [Pseudomonas aphyarum]MDD1125158.1 RDD family protein [Pseudomonas aphyarum]